MNRVVLFVCTGNVCRSPMAQALFAAHARRVGDGDLFTVQSAGTWAPDNQHASGHAITVMARRGIDIARHRARTITRREMDQADVIIVMTRSHREALAAEFPEHRPKLHMLSELRNRLYDIPDPYGGTLKEYEFTAQEIEKLVDEGYAKIKSWATNTDAPAS